VTPDEVAAFKDPEARAVAAQVFITEAKAAITAVLKVRDEAVAAMRLAGATQRDVAALLGLSPARVTGIDREQGLESTRGARRSRVAKRKDRA